MAWRINLSEKTTALEQLRFNIIGSNLLVTDRNAMNGHGRRQSIPQLMSPSAKLFVKHRPTHTRFGLLCSVGVAFSYALSIWWGRKATRAQQVTSRMWVVGVFLSLVTFLLYSFWLREYRRYAGNLAIETASFMVSNAQAFDSSAHAAIAFIQDVEFVSRRSRLSNPLPSVFYLDDGGDHSRRCARLRHALRSALDSLTKPHFQAYHSLQPYTNTQDFERYCDMYELSRVDIEDIQESIIASTSGSHYVESIKALKVDLHRLFTARKLFLCCILALNADLTSNSLDWTIMTEMMGIISNKTAVSAVALDDIMCEEDQFSVPSSPMSPMTPVRNKMRRRIRHFSTVSQGLRGLQARMHILTEDCDKVLGFSDEVTEVGSYLLEQYDAFGADLDALVKEWQNGRALLTANIDKHERRLSLSPSSLLQSPITPTSLGGFTAVGNSPSEAFKILTGQSTPSPGASSSEEEVFEAVGSPRPRSTLKREERIAQMKEERARQDSAREGAKANRVLIQELKTVIKQGRPASTG